MAQNSKENITKNLFWRLIERFGAQGVTFVVSIVLARLLDPSVYGMITIVTVFTSILQVFVDSGLGNALIQKKDADDLDFSSVFFFNLLFCVVLYGLMFVASPYIASFFTMPDLIPVLRVLSLTIVISGVKNVQQAYVSRNLMFKKFFFATLGGTLGASVIGIIMAYRGYGVWALVVQSLFNATMDTCILWATVKWRPKRMFSFERLKVLFSYGWKLLVSKLIDTVYEDVRSLIVGKMYSPDDLAYFDRGKKFPQLAVDTLNSSIDSVLFPSMSMEQDDISRVRAMTSRAIKTMSYIIFPLMVGLAVCSESIVNIILTPKWAECVPYMQIFCIGLAIVPISIANLNAIKAIGRSDIYLRLEIIRKSLNTVSLLALMWFGVKAIAYSYLLNCIMNVAVNAAPNKKFLNYGYRAQVKDLAPAFVLSAVMGIIVYLVSFFGFADWITLIIQISVGVGIYVAGSALFKIDSFYYVLSIMNGLLHRGKKED
ncbi:MAG: lipopolysaccharide biosynthesis protein [Lachnospiraceae bacterium]|nr:lipopolysaccharide biosynthesis protein [Lachnospiraceae bacterium]